jgi:hypothetical protein
MKRRLTDFENQAVSSQHPRKRRKRLNRAADADESIENPNSLEDRTREKGRLFTIQEALFLVDDSVFEVDEDEDFDESAEFTTDKNKIQGQLRQVLRYLPNDAKPFRSTTLVSGAVRGFSRSFPCLTLLLVRRWYEWSAVHHQQSPAGYQPCKDRRRHQAIRDVFQSLHLVLETHRLSAWDGDARAVLLEARCSHTLQ